MHRASRALTLSLVALVALGGCKKKPEVAPTPGNTAPGAGDRRRRRAADRDWLQRRMRDSIGDAEARRNE